MTPQAPGHLDALRRGRSMRWSRWMRAAFLLLTSAAAGSLAAAEDTGGDDTSPHTDVRRQILSEIKYNAPAENPAPAAPFLSATATQPRAPDEPADPDLLQMAPFTVQETVKTERLHGAFLQQKADARTAAMMNKLGVGVHVASAGGVYVYAATLFYIPFAVGGGFAW
jgi:hypothetical protein